QALQYVSEKKGVPMEKLTIPSQRRYISYFTNLLEGVRPRSEPLLLRRVIMNTIPTFGTRGGAMIWPGGEGKARVGVGGGEGGEGGEGEESGGGGGGEEVGCCPYLQIFKGGMLIFTASYKPEDGLHRTGGGAEEGAGASGAGNALHEGDGGEAGGTGAAGPTLPWAYTSDYSISFVVDCAVQGDLLVRCRHLSPSGRRVSMFRAAFHTGFVPCGVLRLTKAQLDGACADSRFHQDFFLDLIFAPLEMPLPDMMAGSGATEEGSAGRSEGMDQGKGLVPGEKAGGAGAGAGTGAGTGSGDGALEESASQNSASARREGGLVVDADPVGAYDSMLHQDTRFWEEIKTRKERRAELAGKRARTRGKATAPPEGKGAVTAVGAGDRSSEKTRFSIDEDEAGQVPPSKAPPSSSASAAGAGLAGISADDLLAQLAEFDELEEGGGHLRSAHIPTPPLASGVASEGAGASEASAFPPPHREDVSEPGTGSVTGSWQEVSPGEKAGGGRDTEGGKGTLTEELSQLEELERELGIMSLGGAVGAGGGDAGAGGQGKGGVGAGEEAGVGGGQSGAGASGEAFDIDNLDELEGYLESLAAVPSGIGRK
ncbi:unnamed protein product, partial [Discosporangium mesarthrocarpum]